MVINLSNSLIGLGILTGDNSGFSGMGSLMAAIPSKEVSRAKANFTTPVTTPPWKDPAPTTSLYRQVEAVKRLRTIIDTLPNPSAAGQPDVQTSFVTYKALDRLKLLAAEAAKAGTSAGDRAALDKAFAKGLDDLHAYLAEAPSDKVSLYFDQPRRKAESLGIPAENVSGKVVGTGVSATRGAPLAGLTGSETIQIKLAKGNLTRTLTVDLSDYAIPPTLDSVAEAINDTIKAEPLLDAGGTPILKPDGTPASRWQSKVVVEKIGDSWGLSFQPSGIEQVSIDQAGAADSLMVVAGQSVKDMPDVAKILRFDNAATTPLQKALGRLAGIDRDATAKAAAEAKPPADKKDGSKPVEPQSVAANTAVGALITDAQGYSYVVGTTTGDVGYSRSDGNDDLFLTKLDSEGKVVWQRTLGTVAEAQGAAITIAANGDIVVAGNIRGFGGSLSKDSDMLVSRFGANGDEIFSTAVGTTGDDSASAVTVGADGSIYVAGKTSTGRGDAYVTRLDAQGRIAERRTLADSGGNDSVTALAMDASGDLLVLTRESGKAVLHRLDGAALATDLGSIDLGTAEARAIAVSASGEIAVVGTTSAPLNGAQVGTMNGEADGFVARIDAGLTGATTSYVGTDKSDEIDSVVFMGGALYVGGRTAGALNGALRGKVDGFVARIEADGSIGSVNQFGSGSTQTSAVYVSAATGGSGIMGALGLHRGTLNAPDSTALTARTSLRADDSFKIRIDGLATREIVIDKDETMATLADKLRKLLGAKATVSTPKVKGLTTLRVEAKEGYTVEFLSGDPGKDALSKLGIEPGKIILPKTPGPLDPKVTPGGNFALLLSDTLSLDDRNAAGVALKAIESALSMTQSAYRSLYWDDSKEAMVNGSVKARGSAYQQAQLANYQAALSRLTGATF